MNAERAVAFAEELARVAAAGGGVAALAERLAAAAGCPVLLEDRRWQRLARAGGGTSPESARAVVESAAPGRAIEVLAGDARVAWLSAFPEPDPTPGAGADTLGLLMRLAAAAIGAELARAPEADRGARRRLFWERLLARAYHDAASARDDAAAHAIVLAPAYLTVALEVASGPGRPALAELRTAAGEVFCSGDADLGFLERGAALLAFVPAAREVDASNARTAAGLLPKRVAKRTPAWHLSGGVGTVEAPTSLYASAEAAEAALAIGRRVFGCGRVAVYEELGAYPLLYEGADVRRLQTFARRVLDPLRAYDGKHQTELERTLRIYFEAGQNVKMAASRLGVHRHTVFYRLRQIGEISGHALESPHDHLTLRLAVAIDALHSP